MPKLPIKISSLPKPPVPSWLKNYENKAKGYSYVNLVIHVYQLYSFWFDIYYFGNHFFYGLIYVGFVIFPVALSFFLLITVHKRELRKVGYWWVLEIAIFLLHITLYVVGLYGISWKTILNIFLHGSLRIFGLKVIYNYMLMLSSEISLSINKVDVRDHTKSPTMDDIPLDDPWSGEEKL